MFRAVLCHHGLHGMRHRPRRIINCDGIAPGFPGDRHGRNIRDPVADIDHIPERDTAFPLRHVLVDAFTELEFAFIDAEKELRFIRVVDDKLGENGAPSLEIILASVDLLEILPDIDAVEDLLKPA